MSKLIAVEYSPSYAGGKKAVISPLFGCIGETRKDMLLRALANIERASREGGNPSNIRVPVRFPLASPNSRLSFWMNDRDPLDPLLLREEGKMISPYDLHLVDRKPVSYYSGEKMTPGAKLDRLFESERFLYTHSHAIMLAAVREASNHFSHVWTWKQEWSGGGGPPPVFYEARFYGIDTVISTYDPHEMQGLAVEIISRPWPDTELRKKGVLNIRMHSDVFLFSKGKEYISHIDGVEVKREGTNFPALHKRLASLMKAGDALKVRSNLDKYKGSPEPKKDAMPTWSIGGSATTTSFTISTNTTGSF